MSESLRVVAQNLWGRRDDWDARRAIAWESLHGDEPGHTFTRGESDHDRPRLAPPQIDYVFVRCGDHEGPTLEIADCRRLFDQPVDGVWASHHFGLCADFAVPDLVAP